MTMLLRRQMMRKASGDWRDLYQQVAYLEVPDDYNAQPWIDTGVIPTENTVSQIKFLNKVATGDAIFGFQKSVADTNKYRFFNYSQQLYFDLPSGLNTTNRLHPTNPTVPISIDTIYELELGDKYVKDLVSGNVLASGNSVTFVSGISDTLTTGYNRTNGAVSRNIWYYVKIYDGASLIRDMIPCYRKADNKPGLYDAARDRFFTNAGTGEFVVGPDVTPEGYIKSGLVLFLDGLNRGGVTGEWHDLIDSENIVTLTGNYTENTNGVYFPGANDCYGTFEKAVAVSWDVGTIEGAVELTEADGTGRPLLSMGNSKIGGSIAMGTTGNAALRYYLYANTMPNWNVTLQPEDLKLTFSGNAARAYINGEACTEGSTSQFSSSVSKRLANRGGGNPFKGTMFSLRVYNRQLTAAEMLHNQRIDNARFNLGLTI